MARDLREDTTRVYAADVRSVLEDLEGLIAAAVNGRPPAEATRVAGELELDAYEAYRGVTRKAPPVTVPPRVQDLARIRVGRDQVAIVRIVPPRERLAARLVATIALLAAVAFLLFLLAL